MKIILAGSGFLAIAAAVAAELTTVEITDKKLVADTVRLGINICSDNYWDSSIVKLRIADNFEGVRYRMCTWGPLQDEHGVYVWFPPDAEAWEAMKGKVRYTILGGPAKGITGLIQDIEKKVCPVDPQKRELCYLRFDKEVPRSPMINAGGINGVLLELDRLDQGCIRDTENPAYWNSLPNTAHIGDVPPGSFGCAALWLKGADQPAHYAYVPMWASQAEQTGRWHIRFWTKAKAGQPKLQITTGADQNPFVPITEKWEKHDLTLVIENMAPNSHLTIRFVASDGEVLVDDVEIWKEENDQNPTPFRDHFVKVLRELRPGVIRFLQMGGSDLETNLRPPLRRIRWSRNFADLTRGGRNRANGYDFNLHDFYVLAEYIGADPWYCLPGTIHPEEIKLFMEYLGAPADVGGGKIRAALGHPRPWTEVFRNVYVEFGNEAWNPSGYATGSFNGPDHWKDLITFGKQSLYYRSSVVFVLGSQAGSVGVTKQVLQATPNGDRLAVAPYLIHRLTAQQAAMFSDDDALFRWVFGFTLRRACAPEGIMPQHYQLTRAANSELAIYEHHYHTTAPSVKDGGAPIEFRNKYIASIGGGVNLINDSLVMMKELNLRTQCLFNLNQRSFREGVKLWGITPGLDYRDQRYRPTYLAAQIANRVIGGNLVETLHSGAAPTFTATGWFEGARDQILTYENFPVLWSYAFCDRQQHGLILVNLDTREPHVVALKFSGQAKGGTATAWWLTADRITANNESDHPPEVQVREETLNGFGTGWKLQLPPFSMVALRWEAARK